MQVVQAADDAVAGRPFAADRRRRLGMPPQHAPTDTALSNSPHRKRLKKAHFNEYCRRASSSPVPRRACSVQFRRIFSRSKIAYCQEAVVGPLADHSIQPPPIVGRNRSSQPYRSRRMIRIIHAQLVLRIRQIGQGLFDAGVGFGLVGPAGVLGQTPPLGQPAA